MTNNNAVIEFNRQAREAGAIEEYDTYAGWQARGFQVRKGAKSCAVLEGRGCHEERDYSKSKRGRKVRYFYDRKIYLFSSKDLTQPYELQQDATAELKTDEDGFIDYADLQPVNF